MKIDLTSLLYGFLLALILGSAIGAAMHALYQRGFEAGERAGEEGSVNLSEDDLEHIYWMATNGFQRLLLLGAKGDGGI